MIGFSSLPPTAALGEDIRGHAASQRRISLSQDLEENAMTHPQDAFLERLTATGAAAFDVVAIYLGDELGLYRSLAEIGPASPTDLARATGLYRRPIREWLEHGAASGLLQQVDRAEDPNDNRYRLPEAHAPVLADPSSESFWPPTARQLVATVGTIHQVVSAFRTGQGFTLGETSDEMRVGEASSNKAGYLDQLVSVWLPAVDGLDARLRADPPARIADIGCGLGWSTIAMALGYPKVRVDGLDLDAPSIDLARENAIETGVADRVSFAVRSADDPGLSGRYDLVTVFEAFHDMARPIAVLRALRSLLLPGGCIVIGDTKAGDVFRPPTDARERLHYGWSLTHCLYSSFGGPEDEQTGTMLRPPTLRRYGSAAGLTVEVLPIEHESWQFYVLRPEGGA
jgi:SAM-dependent methyltransferase